MKDNMFKAILFDTRSIQNYIYSGNRLRTNIGASYIVDRIFFDTLVEGTLKKMFPDDDFSTAEDTTWDHEKDGEKSWDSMKECCVAYIGGGNALILLNESKSYQDAVAVVKDFTLNLLATRPGLKVGAAIGDLSITDGKLDMSPLYAKLKKNQSTVFPAVNVPYTGLTLSCEINGEAANFCDTKNIVNPESSGDIRFYSQETAVKSAMAKKANEDLKRRFDKIFELKKSAVRMANYEFPLSVNELGQKDGENYFSVIHVDGNNMGVKFRGCDNLSDRRRLSREIKRKTEGAFADLLLKIIAAKDSGIFDDCLTFTEITKNILPIRPLIIGGDDVTFVCPANMAILFTKTLMEILNDVTPENTAEHLTQESSRQMDCCAGVAILPTAYPFFRGYELAEQLCDAAKKSMRDFAKNKKTPNEDLPVKSSWLDYAILHGEQAPTLEQIRERSYSGVRGSLHFGPYRVANEDAQNTAERRKNIENLLACTTQFPHLMGQGKYKELRDVLQRGKDDTAKYLQQLKRLNIKLPAVPDWDFLKSEDNLLWTVSDEPQTPYVDAIELIDFYVPEVVEKWQSLT